MKKIALFTFIIILTLQAQAQQRTAPQRFGQENSYYTYPLYGDVEEIVIYFYSVYGQDEILDTLRFNERGDLLSHKGYTYDDTPEDWIKWTYKYDRLGRNTSIVKKYYGYTDLFDTNEINTFYDNRGRIEYEVSSWKYPSSTPNKRIQYVYNNRGQLVQKGETKYTYLGDKLYIEDICQEEYKTREVNKYDNNGNIVESKTYYDDELYNTKVIEYNDRGLKRLEKNTNPTWSETSAPSIPHFIKYKYDNAGRKIEEARIYKDYREYIIRITTQYIYDSEGKLTTEITSYTDPEYSATDKFTYKYDNMGNIIEEKYWHGEHFRYRKIYKITYR